MSNYQITGVRLHHFPELIYGLAYVKKAAAIVNARLGLLPRDVADAIAHACDALTSSRAPRALRGGRDPGRRRDVYEHVRERGHRELSRHRARGAVGSYDKVHPNDHVNLCQSTNCAFQ